MTMFSLGVVCACLQDMRKISSRSTSRRYEYDQPIRTRTSYSARQGGTRTRTSYSARQGGTRTRLLWDKGWF